MTEDVTKKSVHCWVLVVLASGSRAHLTCSGTLGLFILLENSHFRERVQLVPKPPWLIKNQPYIIEPGTFCVSDRCDNRLLADLGEIRSGVSRIVRLVA